MNQGRQRFHGLAFGSQRDGNLSIYMTRFLLLVVLTVLCGCRSPRPEPARAAQTGRTAWEEAAKRIREAETEESQVAAILHFHQLFNQLSDVEPVRSYSWMYFNEEGRMLLPGDSRDDARFVVLYDFENKPALFLPFLVQLRGKHARQMLELPK